MKITYNPEICTECRSCEMACSMYHFKVYNEKKAALKLFRNFPDYKLNYCRHCAKAACQKVCSSEAIVEKNGILIVCQDMCTDCGACIEACPFGAVFALPEGNAFKCDTCDGKYSCVEACITGALTLK